MKYLLDTNIISYFLTGKYPCISNKFASILKDNISIPSIVLAEIEYGARKSIDYNKTIDKYSKFCNVFTKSFLSNKAIWWYGIIRSRLERNGELIGSNDLMIASIALAENRILVTHNVKEFARIPELKIEDWTVD